MFDSVTFRLVRSKWSEWANAGDSDSDGGLSSFVDGGTDASTATYATLGVHLSELPTSRIAYSGPCFRRSMSKV